jgi:hypothetical protein
MKTQRYAQNKSEAARLAGMSRRSLYHLLRLNGAPISRADGRWDVAAIRKFALKSAKRLEGPLKRDELQEELLTLKIRRATQELTDFEQELRDSISAELGKHFVASVNLLAGRLKGLPRDLAAKCEGMSAREIFNASSDLLWRAFEVARQEFLARMPNEKAEQPKVLPFKARVESNGNGTAVLNRNGATA